MAVGKMPIYFSLPIAFVWNGFFLSFHLIKSLSSPKINEAITWELFGLSQGFFVSVAHRLLCVSFVKFICFRSHNILFWNIFLPFRQMDSQIYLCTCMNSPFCPSNICIFPSSHCSPWKMLRVEDGWHGWPEHAGGFKIHLSSFTAEVNLYLLLLVATDFYKAPRTFCLWEVFSSF